MKIPLGEVAGGAFRFMQLLCHSGDGCTLPAYVGSVKEWRH